jgi:hypothetical protein
MRAYRFGLLALGGLALLAGIWGGLIRIGWPWPPLQPSLLVAHGPLMIAGFLGVVIGLERAVALGRAWGFGAPLLAGLGVLALLTASSTLAAALFVASSLLLVLIFVRLYRLRPEWSSLILSVAAAGWLVGNLLWFQGQPLPRIVPWWAGFLVLTIAGERLELAQVLLGARPRAGLLAACSLVLAGLVASLPAFALGLRLAGLGLLMLAIWLARYDVARRALRRPGLPRFGAVCLLAGYAWLGLSGLLWLLQPELLQGGFWYDAVLHSLFLGFVFSMIFAHAPTIVPAVTGLAVPFRTRFYLHVGLLHASLLLRVVGDLAAHPDARRLGGLLNALAILLFLVLTAQSARGRKR